MKNHIIVKGGKVIGGKVDPFANPPCLLPDPPSNRVVRDVDENDSLPWLIVFSVGVFVVAMVVVFISLRHAR